MQSSQPIKVNVFVLSPDTRSERRYDLNLTVGQLKNKLELITGVPVGNQSIAVLASEAAVEPLVVLADDSRPLGSYGVRDWQVLKVTDLDPATSITGQLSDTSQVDKFELSEAEYAQRQDTVMAYKQRHKIGRFADHAAQDSERSEDVECNISLGSRCEVESTEEDFRKRGTVKFVGPTEFAKGIWVGIEYDEPIGKNDGSVKGKRYFECLSNFGVFVRQDRVKVGDFPVEELSSDDEM